MGSLREGWVGNRGQRTSENEPGQRQNDQVRHHVQGGIDVVELGLVEADAALDRLVPVEVERPALKEQGDREGALRGHDPGGEPKEDLSPSMVRRQDSDEEQDDGKLDDAE